MRDERPAGLISMKRAAGQTYRVIERDKLAPAGQWDGIFEWAFPVFGHQANNSAPTWVNFTYVPDSCSTSQQVLWVGVTEHPTAERIANQLTEACGWEQIPRYLIRDRDGAYGEIFIRRVRSIGIRDRPTSPRSSRNSRPVRRWKWVWSCPTSVKCVAKNSQKAFDRRRQCHRRGKALRLNRSGRQRCRKIGRKGNRARGGSISSAAKCRSACNKTP
jgi:hypothetical protein